MAETVKKKDFIELDYTGKLESGMVFDTTLESEAKEHNLHSADTKYSPAVICIGENQLIPGLDEDVVGKEVGKEYTIEIPAEKAFGKRDIKKMRMIPLSHFREHEIDPKPGLQVDIDNEMGVVTRVASGRVMVNFNHPLAGKDVIYTYKIKRIITEDKEKAVAFLSNVLRMPKEQIEVEIKEDKAIVSLPAELPVQITNIFVKKLTELTNLKDITFQNKQEKKE